MTDSRQIAPAPAETAARKIRIVHLINSLELGGAESFLCRVSSKMDRRAFEGSVVSLTRVGPIGEQILAAGIPVTPCNMPTNRPTVAAFRYLVSKLREERPDVIMTWMNQSDLLGLIVGRLAKVPHLVWNIRNSAVHRQQAGRRNALLKRFSARFSSGPDLVIFNSEAGLKAHTEIGYRPRRVELIPNGYDMDVFAPDRRERINVRQSIGVSDGTPVVGLFGHFRPVKNHRMFFEAAKVFMEMRPDAHYVLAGRGVHSTNATLREMLGPLISDERIHLLGELQDVPRVLNAIDVMSMCSLSEGFPNAVGEAMAMGIPCVVTRSAGDAPRMVGPVGRVVPLDDAPAMASAWLELFQQPEEEFAAMRLAVRKRIADSYSLESITNRYESLLTEIVRK